MIEWRVKYPGSVWGKLRTVWHSTILRHDCRRGPVLNSRFVMYDDTCQVAWWT